MGLGKGAHQFSKLLFPFRYWLQVKKNDYQTFLNKLATPLPTLPPTTLAPSATKLPSKFPTTIPKKNYTQPKTNTYYYLYPTSKPLPTYDNTWYNQQVQKSQQDYQNRVNQMNQDYQNSVNQMNQDYQNSVQKMQQDTEAWKKAHGF